MGLGGGGSGDGGEPCEVSPAINIPQLELSSQNSGVAPPAGLGAPLRELRGGQRAQGTLFLQECLRLKHPHSVP